MKGPSSRPVSPATLPDIVALLLLIAVVALLSPALAAPTEPPAPPARGEFVDAARQIPDLVTDIRYAGHYNFVGTPIDGYRAPRCLLTREAAEALERAQARLRPEGLGLIVYDCYRPQRAVDHFVRWARDLEDTAMKQVFYPRVAKDELFEKGYIAERSGHSRGSTLDVSLVRLPAADTDPPLARVHIPMGTPYDFFDPLSHTDNPALEGEIRDNRQQLKSVMEAEGFRNLPEEWWHYTLVNEPWPERYFDFPVERMEDNRPPPDVHGNTGP